MAAGEPIRKPSELEGEGKDRTYAVEALRRAVRVWNRTCCPLLRTADDSLYESIVELVVDGDDEKDEDSGLEQSDANGAPALSGKSPVGSTASALALLGESSICAGDGSAADEIQSERCIFSFALCPGDAYRCTCCKHAYTPSSVRRFRLFTPNASFCVCYLCGAPLEWDDSSNEMLSVL